MEILMIDGSAENSIVSMWSEVKVYRKESGIRLRIEHSTLSNTINHS